MTLDGSTHNLVGAHEVDGEELQHYPLPVGVGILAGSPICVGRQVGVTLENADADGNAVCDEDRKRWKFDVNNVTGFDTSTGDESTWKAVEVGDVVYIDQTTFALTLSPTNGAGADNIPFGTVCPKTWNAGDAAAAQAYSGTSTATTEEDVFILVGDYRA